MGISASTGAENRIRSIRFGNEYAVGDIVPVPPCYWIDAEGDVLPHPALIYGFAPGVTR